MQQELVNHPVGAVHFCGGRFQSADAAPDNGFVAMVVPTDSAIKFSAFTADNDLCKTVIAGVGALPAGWASVNYPAANKLLLHLHEELFWNNGFVVILYVVLRNRAVVGYLSKHPTAGRPIPSPFISIGIKNLPDR